ncbi:hypothetical protein [uncultured Idiomarina sp.]|uniref:hypothetical protein n=1 Tax=uncultured Idiomarina sp. TaxID=352961 RepID=UPI0032B17E7D
MVHLQIGTTLLSLSENRLQWWVDGEPWHGRFFWQCLFNTWLLVRLSREALSNQRQSLYFCIRRNQLTPALWCQLRRGLICQL